MIACRLFIVSIGLGAWAFFYWFFGRHIPAPRGMEFIDRILGICFLIAVIGCPCVLICGFLSLFGWKP